MSRTGRWRTWAASSSAFTSHSRRADAAAALAKQFPLDQFKGDSVLVGLNAWTGICCQFKRSLVNMGMQVVDTNATDGLVDGYLPISQLPAAARAAPDSEPASRT